MLPQALLASRLFVTCFWLVFVGHGLSYIYFGQVHKGLVVLGTVERIRLPFGTLCLYNLACLSQLTELVAPGRAVMPNEAYFGQHIQVFY